MSLFLFWARWFPLRDEKFGAPPWDIRTIPTSRDEGPAREWTITPRGFFCHAGTTYAFDQGGHRGPPLHGFLLLGLFSFFWHDSYLCGRRPIHRQRISGCPPTENFCHLPTLSDLRNGHPSTRAPFETPNRSLRPKTTYSRTSDRRFCRAACSRSPSDRCWAPATDSKSFADRSRRSKTTDFYILGRS